MYQVLIIEDEQDTAKPVKEALELHNVTADIAIDGEQGLKMFLEKEYDLILLDLKMPKMSGEEVLRKIRDINPYVYVIVYTNYSNFVDIKALTNIGIDGYINKGPAADLEELITMIKNKLDPLDDLGIKNLIGGQLD